MNETIITTIIVHNDNFNYSAPASLLIYLPNLRNVAIDENVLDVPDVVVVEVD